MAIVEVRVPKFGMSAVDVEVLEVLVEVGQRVEVGTPLLETGADKVDVTIEAEKAGTVSKIYCEPGQTYLMGTVLMELTEN